MLGVARHRFALPVGGRAEVEHHALRPDAFDDARLSSADHAMRDPLHTKAERLLDARRLACFSRVTRETQAGGSRGLEGRALRGCWEPHLIAGQVEADHAASGETAGLARERDIFLRCV